jgi:hypothetical protein
MSCSDDVQKVYEGDTWTRTFTWPAGTDLTGYTFSGQARDEAGDLVASFTFDETILDEGSVIASISFADVEPGYYDFSVRYVDTLDQPLTFYGGKFLVEENPTHE